MALLDFKFLRKSITDIGGKARELAAQIEELKQSRERLQDLPLTRLAYTRVVHTWLDEQSRLFDEHFAHQTANDRARYTTRPSFPILESNGAAYRLNLVHPQNIYGLFAPILKDSVTAAIDRLPWPSDSECGSGPEMRDKELAAIDKKIAQLEAEQAELHAAAAEAGVSLTGASMTPTGKAARPRK